MEDQFEEKEVLEMDAWNTEYDIAEEEEERLLEDHEIAVVKHGFSYENEPNFSDTEFETPETEEDILDLGLNEDIIEYEEGNASCQEPTIEAKQGSAQTSQGSEPYMGTSINRVVNNSLNQDNSQKYFAVRSGQSNFNHSKNHRFKHQANFPIPVQMRNIPPPRTGPPGFHNHRPHFDGPSRSLLGRTPILNYHGSRGGFLRQSAPMGCEPLFVQDFHGLPSQRFQRHPFKDNHLGNHHPALMEYERNNSMNRFFINPHYRGSVTVQNGCTSRISPLTETRLTFSTPDDSLPRTAFQNRHQRPPPGPSLANISRSVPIRYAPPPQSNMPPPRLNGPINEISPPRFKLAAPQNLMDMVLPAPFGDGHMPISYQSEQPRPQRFRFNPFEPPTHSYDPTHPVRFIAPPPSGSKRQASSEVPITAPLKQLRLGPMGNIQVLRTFPPPTVSLNSAHPLSGINVTVSANPTVRPSGISVPISMNGPQRPPNGITLPAPTNAPLRPNSFQGVQNQRPAVFNRRPPPKLNPPRPPLVSSASVSNSSVVVVSTSPTASVSVASSQPPSTSNASTNLQNNTEDSSPEMKEYLEKMEEQRKKREEVLRMKEERRRQKLASLSGKGELDKEAPSTTQSPEKGSTSTSMTQPMTRVHEIREPNSSVTINPGESSQSETGLKQPQTAFQVKDNNVSPNQRKTVFVKPTPTVQPTSPRVIPQASVGVNRRYKIIIVKNKSGKILEKRRVPIDEPASSSSQTNDSCNLVRSPPNTAPLNQATIRVSETVTIENLNANVTEDYVWKLCQMFGSVQEVYPKLQEGKAIVRFSSSGGANNFVMNHNSPGICVRFL